MKVIESPYAPRGTAYLIKEEPLLRPSALIIDDPYEAKPVDRMKLMSWYGSILKEEFVDEKTSVHDACGTKPQYVMGTAFCPCCRHDVSWTNLRTRPYWETGPRKIRKANSALYGSIGA